MPLPSSTLQRKANEMRLNSFSRTRRHRTPDKLVASSNNFSFSQEAPQDLTHAIRQFVYDNLFPQQVSSMVRKKISFMLWRSTS